MIPQPFSSRLLLLAALSPFLVHGYNWDCNLHCFNDGVCKHGAGRFGSYTGMESFEQDTLPFEQEEHIDGMYCQCPRGYVGLQCEIKMKECLGPDGSASHVCFNGSECKRERDGDGRFFYHCECDVANSDLTTHKYAGKYCEHVSTVFCNHRASDSSSTESFCVNGGKCKETADHGASESEGGIPHHVGCICPDGWIGARCELPDEEYLKKNRTYQEAYEEYSKKVNFGLIFGVLVAAIVVFGAGIMLYRHRQEQLIARRSRGDKRYGTHMRPSSATMELA